MGAITVLGLYKQFHDKWFLEEAWEPLLKWNRWWAEHRDMDGFIVLGSDAENQPVNRDDGSVGTWQGAVFESGLDNSPMYDGTTYNPKTHLLEYADVGMTSLYIADCDALAEIANALEILREETPQGFVPNYARAGGWKSEDRSEPPVGAITVLGLYRQFQDRWFLEDAYEPLMKWNRWWAAHRDIQGYLAWGSDGGNEPQNLDDGSRGTHQGAEFESGLDNSPMYDGTYYNPDSHLIEYADVGLMSMYVADCDALAEIADTLGKTEDAKELRGREDKYRAKLATMWDERAGMFLNKDLHTGESSRRLSPTNFYPMLAHAATAEQAKTMLEKHLLNPEEFWGEWVIPSIARNDPAFKEQEYWRGRIWGPMNYLVYLGLENYDAAKARDEFAEKSYALFLKEWREKGHVHENYNAVLGTGDDVTSSDRFYHWGALLGYIESLQQGEAKLVK